LLAGGAALAGFAGAAIARSRNSSRGGALSSLRDAIPSRSHSSGFSLPKLPRRGNGLKGGVRKVSHNISEAAEQADRIGQRVSNVANAVRKVSETADEAAKKA
jgi:methyl-accepting chemotaxis protein